MKETIFNLLEESTWTPEETKKRKKQLISDCTNSIKETAELIIDRPNCVYEYLASIKEDAKIIRDAREFLNNN